MKTKYFISVFIIFLFSVVITKAESKYNLITNDLTKSNVSTVVTQISDDRPEWYFNGLAHSTYNGWTLTIWCDPAYIITCCIIIFVDDISYDLIIYDQNGGPLVSETISSFEQEELGTPITITTTLVH